MTAEYEYHPLCGNIINPNREEMEPIRHEPLNSRGECSECEQLWKVDRWARLQEQDRIIGQLESCREGRVEYAVTSPTEIKQDLMTQADALASAILIAAGDIRPLYDFLPSWRWGEAGLPAPMGDLDDTSETGTSR